MSELSLRSIVLNEPWTTLLNARRVPCRSSVQACEKVRDDRAVPFLRIHKPERAREMRSDPDVLGAGSVESPYTHLFASISEEEDGYTAEVRLYSRSNQQSAHGEEIAGTLEMASMWIAAIANKFSISQTFIKIEILMQRVTDGTRH